MTVDVVIAGSGPGGAATAAFLAREGLDVVLIDKETFPRDKPCGDAISGKSQAVLEELGIVDTVEENPHAIALGVRFSSPAGDELVVPFPKEYHPDGVTGKKYPYVAPGYVSRREVFDNLVHEAAIKAGAVFKQGQVSEVLFEGKQAVGVKLKDGEEVRARAVVGADGALSAVARSVGTFERDPKHWVAAIREYWHGVEGLDDNIEIHFIDDVIPGYFWIFPTDDGMANVGLGMLSSEIRKRDVNLHALQDHVIQNHPVFSKRFENAKVVEGSRRAWNLPVGSKHRRIHGDGWVLVGDAAALIDPFSGEGIGNAMVSGRLASEVLIEALRTGDLSAENLSSYEKMVREEMDEEFKSSHKLQKLGRFKFLLNFVVRRAATKPHVGEMLSDMLADRERQDELGQFKFYLKLLFS